MASLSSPSPVLASGYETKHKGLFKWMLIRKQGKEAKDGRETVYHLQPHAPQSLPVSSSQTLLIYSPERASEWHILGKPHVPPPAVQFRGSWQTLSGSHLLISLEGSLPFSETGVVNQPLRDLTSIPMGHVFRRSPAFLPWKCAFLGFQADSGLALILFYFS